MVAVTAAVGCSAEVSGAEVSGADVSGVSPASAGAVKSGLNATLNRQPNKIEKDAVARDSVPNLGGQQTGTPNVGRLSVGEFRRCRW